MEHCIYNEFNEIVGFNSKVNINEVNWICISKYQKLSESFIREFNLEISETNWLYKDSDYKLEKVKDSGLYEIDGDYIIAYKSVKFNGDSVYKSNFYNYQINGIYESNADFNIDEENSFGLSAWTTI